MPLRMVHFAVTEKPVDAELQPSLTNKVIVVLPVAPATGRTVMVRDEPEPPSAMLPLGTRPVFEEYALTLR